MHEGKRHVVGQGNNAFIFPGLGFGSILAGAREVTNSMVLEASHALVDYNAERHLGEGLVFPPVEELQQVSERVAVRVVQRAIADGVATNPKVLEDGADIEGYVKSRAWKAKYLPVRRAL